MMSDPVESLTTSLGGARSINAGALHLRVDLAKLRSLSRRSFLNWLRPRRAFRRAGLDDCVRYCTGRANFATLY